MAPRWKSDYPRKPPRFAWLRAILPLLIIVSLFSFLLSSIALLSHFRSPAAKQQLGWQAYDVVEMHYAQKTGSAGGNGTDGGETDIFTPSIPLDIWDPLSTHTTGLTEVIVHACYFPPYLLPSYCMPPTTPEEDKAKGKWVMVTKDLNLRTGIWYLNMYYRRTRRLDVPLITDLRVVPEPVPETLKSDLDGWTQAKGDLHDGIWPTQPVMRLWYRVADQSTLWTKRQSVTGGEKDIITELDIVYGDAEPFFGFQRVQGGKVLDEKPGKWESVDLAYRRGNPIAAKADPPRFHTDGTFKILQIADLHFSVGSGECRDTDKSPCIGDADTLEWLHQALDAEKPDLVVFSGDQLNGQKTSYDARSVIAKVTKPVIDRQIPWCAIFGNHDSEIAEDRAEQMRALQQLPYSLAQPGPQDVDGVGNYVIKLHSDDASRIHIFTLYFLDSGSYQQKTLPWVNADYDYIKESQIQWFLNESASIQPIERPFRPDGADDLDKIWRRSPSPNRIPRQKTLAKPNAIMWFHIPLQEAYNDPDQAYTPGSGSGSHYEDGRLQVGSFDDGKGSSKHNSGFFYNGIKKAFEADVTGDAFATPTAEVKVLGHGHTHNTDMCRRVDGIWVCFDGGSSYSGYGKVGFDRRVRIHQLSDYGEKIETYKRLTSGDVVDRQVLVGEGAPDGAGM